MREHETGEVYLLLVFWFSKVPLMQLELWFHAIFAVHDAETRVGA